jgi:hypothetical protein
MDWPKAKAEVKINRIVSSLFSIKKPYPVNEYANKLAFVAGENTQGNELAD